MPRPGLINGNEEFRFGDPVIDGYKASNTETGEPAHARTNDLIESSSSSRRSFVPLLPLLLFLWTGLKVNDRILVDWNYDWCIFCSLSENVHMTGS